MLHVISRESGAMKVSLLFATHINQNVGWNDVSPQNG